MVNSVVFIKPNFVLYADDVIRQTNDFYLEWYLL